MVRILFQILAAIGFTVVLTAAHNWLCRHFPRYDAWLARLPEW